MKITFGRLINDMAQPRPSWDSEWHPTEGYADYGVATIDEPAPNYGGLPSQKPIETAILLCLFLDARMPDDMVNELEGFAAYDRRGWHGDSFDLDEGNGERPIGSLLWTLARAPATYTTLKRAEQYTRQALQTLLDQRVIGRFDIAATYDSNQSGKVMIISIKAYSPSGDLIYANQLPAF
jgi:phage gp46-like protein